MAISRAVRPSSDRTPRPPGRQRSRVPGEHDDQDQRRRGADRVDRDQERDLAVGGGTKDPARDGVIDEAADAGDQPAREQDKVLLDQPVPPDLGQALAETQSSAGLHSPGHFTRRGWASPAGIMPSRCPIKPSPWFLHW